MFDLRLDGPSDPKPNNPASRRRRRERESILLTRGDDEETGPVNLLAGPSSAVSRPLQPPSDYSGQLQAAQKEQPQAVPEEAGSNFYSGLKWQPSKPPVVTRQARTSPLATVPATSARINRDVGSVLGRLGLRSRIPKVASEPTRKASTPPEPVVVPERPVTPPESRPEPELPLKEPELEVKPLVESPAADSARPQLSLPLQLPTSRDPEDVYGFASFQEAFVTEGELVSERVRGHFVLESDISNIFQEAAKEKLGEEEAQSLADPWAKLTKWAVDSESFLEELHLLSDRATIGCGFVSALPTSPFRQFLSYLCVLDRWPTVLVACS
jgi:hypothetical protein